MHVISLEIWTFHELAISIYRNPNYLALKIQHQAVINALYNARSQATKLGLSGTQRSQHPNDYH